MFLKALLSFAFLGVSHSNGQDTPLSPESIGTSAAEISKPASQAPPSINAILKAQRRQVMTAANPNSGFPNYLHLVNQCKNWVTDLKIVLGYVYPSPIAKAQIVIKGKQIQSTSFGNGEKHDYKLFKESKTRFREHKNVKMDSGYQGHQKVHANTDLPIKKLKNYPLQKNRSLRTRIRQVRGLLLSMLSAVSKNLKSYRSDLSHILGFIVLWPDRDVVEVSKKFTPVGRMGSVRVI